MCLIDGDGTIPSHLQSQTALNGWKEAHRLLRVGYTSMGIEQDESVCYCARVRNLSAAELLGCGDGRFPC